MMHIIRRGILEKVTSLEFSLVGDWLLRALRQSMKATSPLNMLWLYSQAM